MAYRGKCLQCETQRATRKLTRGLALFICIRLKIRRERRILGEHQATAVQHVAEEFFSFFLTMYNNAMTSKASQCWRPNILAIRNRGNLQGSSMSLCSLATTIQIFFFFCSAVSYVIGGREATAVAEWQDKTGAHSLRNQEGHVRREENKQEGAHMCDRMWRRETERKKTRRIEKTENSWQNPASKKHSWQETRKFFHTDLYHIHIHKKPMQLCDTLAPYWRHPLP